MPIWLTHHECVTNESQVSHEWAPNESRVISSRTNQTNQMNQIAVNTSHMSLWHLSRIKCNNEKTHTDSHQARLICVHVTNASCVTNESRFDSFDSSDSFDSCVNQSIHVCIIHTYTYMYVYYIRHVCIIHTWMHVWIHTWIHVHTCSKLVHLMHLWWIHTATHQARLICVRVTNESRMPHECLTNESQIDSFVANTSRMTIMNT